MFGSIGSSPISLEPRSVPTKGNSPQEEAAVNLAPSETSAVPDQPTSAVCPTSECEKTDQGPEQGSQEESEKSNIDKLPGSQKELTTEDELRIREMQARDQEVKAHEQSHIAAGGEHVHGGASYEYEQGPDGKRYAVAGEVQIDASPVSGDPEATIKKAQVVRSAALAPANPSSTDRQVASSASNMERQARAELAKERAEHSPGVQKQDEADSSEGCDASGEKAGTEEKVVEKLSNT